MSMLLVIMLNLFSMLVAGCKFGYFLLCSLQNMLLSKCKNYSNNKHIYEN